MNELDKAVLANKLITQSLVLHLVKKGVIDLDEYIEDTEAMKKEIVQGIEEEGGKDKDLAKQIVEEIYNNHLDTVKGDS